VEGHGQVRRELLTKGKPGPRHFRGQGGSGLLWSFRLSVAFQDEDANLDAFIANVRHRLGEHFLRTRYKLLYVVFGLVAERASSSRDISALQKLEHFFKPLFQLLALPLQVRRRGQIRPTVVQ
jgi:hypothetical protein